MAALPDPLNPRVPAPAVPELGDYELFDVHQVPEELGAVRAYRGIIRPFSDNATARRVLRAFDRGLPIHVNGGRVDVELDEEQRHPIDDFLVDMALPFMVLVIEVADSPHPRAYLLDPPMIPRLSASPHLRADKVIQIDGNAFPALCIYSGNLQKFDETRSRLEQFLDQASTYLAKYLIWLRTRALYRRTRRGPELVRPALPRGRVTDVEIRRDPALFWDGYWPGKAAPSGPYQHLATIKPEDDCWCWSGQKYGDCHRPEELQTVTDLERNFACGQMAIKLMSAVYRLADCECPESCLPEPRNREPFAHSGYPASPPGDAG